MESIFLNLEKYSLNEKKVTKENLLAELFGYILKNEKEFRKIFLQNVFNKNKKIINKFIDAEINTQQSISNDSIIDIFIKGNDGNIYIENKVDSNESEGQIERYLKQCDENDFLIYLTPKNYEEPKFIKNKKNKKIFKHIHWEEIYDYLKNYNQKRKSEIISHILSYMEGLFMINIKFTKEELNSAKNAFPFIYKSKILLEEFFLKNINLKIENKLGTNDFKEIGFESYNKFNRNVFQTEFYYFIYRPQKKSWEFYLYFPIKIINGKPYLVVSIASETNDFISFIKKDKNIKEKINNLKCKIEEKKKWWLLIYKEFELKPKPINEIVNELTPKILKAIDELIKSRIIQMLANRSKKIK
jgi:hypothetical protein